MIEASWDLAIEIYFLIFPEISVVSPSRFTSADVHMFVSMKLYGIMLIQPTEQKFMNLLEIKISQIYTLNLHDRVA